MPISPRLDKFLHSRLPIDPDEKILAVYRHHWFAYASSWLLGVIVVVVTMAVAFVLSSVGGGDSDSMTNGHQSQILALAGVFSILVLLATSLPVYLRSQEQIVLTEEALVQILQPSLFASRINQVSLQHIADVSVQQDFIGTVLGYGQIVLETPGEQNNYQFIMLPNPHKVAREIIQAHESFDAALQGGRIATRMTSAVPMAPRIDPQQYQQFLQYQQMVEQQRMAQANDPANPANQPPQNPVAPQ